jgi:hypothetical protein
MTKPLFLQLLNVVIVDRPYYTIVFARNVGITVENLRLKKQQLLKAIAS